MISIHFVNSEKKSFQDYDVSFSATASICDTETCFSFAFNVLYTIHSLNSILS